MPNIAFDYIFFSIHRYASCSNECFILALIYIDRLIQRNNFLLSELNVHRVVVTSVLLAAKFFDDAYYNNAYYAKVGGVLVHEMNGLEVDFLFRINFSLHATPDEFTKYRNELLSHANVGTPSCDLPLMFDDHDGIGTDSTTSSPPAQVSPEIHFSATPSEITSNSMSTIDQQHNGGPYQEIQEPPPSTKHQQRDNVMIVPPDVDYIPNQNGVKTSHDQQSDYVLPSEPSYFGFPLQPQPTFYHHNRRNSMPPVIPQDTAPLINTASANSPLRHANDKIYQPPTIHSGMPKSDPIRSVSSRYSNNNMNAIHDYLQPMNCLPNFPVYDNCMDATTTSSSSSNVTSSTASNFSSSSSSNYYSGNLIFMDHENRIQQPLHLWDGTPITIVQHHHHGTHNNATSSNNNNNISKNTYGASSVGFTPSMNHHHHHQAQPVEVVAMSGVGGLR